MQIITILYYYFYLLIIYHTIALLSSKFLMKYSCSTDDAIIIISYTPVSPRRRLSWVYWLSRNPHQYLYVCSLIFQPLTIYSYIVVSFLSGLKKCLSLAISFGTISLNFYRSTTKSTILGILLTNLKYLKSVSKLMWNTFDTQTCPNGLYMCFPSSRDQTRIYSSCQLSCSIVIYPFQRIQNTRTLRLSCWVFGGFHLKEYSLYGSRINWTDQVIIPSICQLRCYIYYAIQGLRSACYDYSYYYSFCYSINAYCQISLASQGSLCQFISLF